MEWRGLQPAHAPLPTGNDEEQAQLEEAAILFVAAGLLRHDFPGVPDSGAAADRDKSRQEESAPVRSEEKR